MKYHQTNTAKNLAALGFQHSYTSNDPVEEVHYEVWLKGVIDVTIDHERKKIVLNIEEAYCDTENFQESDLAVLERLFNPKQLAP